ncbi:hypothetical protein [Escherichia coli]|uniref:hypothetical protein n=1 Tax=Escherichia coli TaxID=562 RepID=UPI001FF6F572|nr:hypothetical protein [Escherichia coli]
MLAFTQLTLVRNKLREISESPYFSKDMHEYLAVLQEAVDKLYENHVNVADKIIADCTFFITDAVNFFTGSTTKKIPYEIVYCLNDACKKWISEKTLITTALSPDMHGFYFKSVNKNLYSLFDEVLNVKFDVELIQISLPEMYRRRPLCSIPLYHELGHFVDISKGISELACLNYRSKDKGTLPGPEWSNLPDVIWINHCREYFADLFSAQFIGKSGVDFLYKLAGSHPASYTHPSTEDRVKIVSDFLNKVENPVVGMFNAVISALHNGGQIISSCLTLPTPLLDVKSAFDNVRPFVIRDHNEMHAFINSSWQYLCSEWEKPTGIWSGLSQEAIEKTINDLVEKSIRNVMILEKWSAQ